MKTHNIDSAIQKAIHESEDFYSLEANSAKDRIWNNIQIKKQNHPKLIFFRLLSAACILLFIGITAFTVIVINYRNKINTLIEVNKTLKLEANKNISKLKQLGSTEINENDTIFIREKILVSQPLVITKNITDTVYVQQITYIEKDPTNESTTLNQSKNPLDLALQTTENIYKTEIFISNNEPLKQEKKNRFRIRFGGAKDQLNNEISGFTTKL